MYMKSNNIQESCHTEKTDQTNKFQSHLLTPKCSPAPNSNTFTCTYTKFEHFSAAPNTFKFMCTKLWQIFTTLFLSPPPRFTLPFHPLPT